MTELVYVTNVRLPTHRAHGIQIMKMCEAFAAAGAQVTLVAPRLKPTVAEDPFSFYGVARTFILWKVPVLEVVPWQHWLGSWVAYIENLSFALSAAGSLMCRGLLGGQRILYTRDYPTAFILTLLGQHPVIEVHDYRPITPKRRMGFIFQRARYIVTNSEGTRMAIERHYRINPAGIVAAPNGVDVDFFQRGPTVAHARTLMGFSAVGPVIGYVGRLETMGLEKGVALLLNVFARLQPLVPNAHLAIIGGPDNLVRQYQDQAAKLGIPNHAVTFTGQVPPTRIPTALRAIDIAVIPFPATKQLATTASPIKVFEFMAAGKTILASDLPSLRQYLNTDNAAFFAPSDEDDMLTQLTLLLTHPSRAAELGVTAFRDAAQYAWKSRAERILHDISP